jgi:hypothetical protein
VNETRRLLIEALKALRAYKSPSELIAEIAKHLAETEDKNEGAVESFVAAYRRTHYLGHLGQYGPPKNVKKEGGRVTFTMEPEASGKKPIKCGTCQHTFCFNCPCCHKEV